MIYSIPHHFMNYEAIHGNYKVHSVFEHTINFIHKGNMIALHDRTRLESPFGIRLDVDKDTFKAMSHQFKTLIINDKGLSIDTQNFTYNVCPKTNHDLIDLVQKNSALNSGESTILNSAINRVLSKKPVANALLNNAIKKRVNTLKDLLNTNNQALEKSIRDLIGLGNGLTPSGDDILVGLLAGLIMQGNMKQFNDVKRHVETLITPPDKTSIISKQFMLYASKGYFIGETLQLYKQLKNGLDIKSDINKIASLGHSSGTDYLEGLGLATILGGIIHGT